MQTINQENVMSRDQIQYQFESAFDIVKQLEHRLFFTNERFSHKRRLEFKELIKKYNKRANQWMGLILHKNFEVLN